MTATEPSERLAAAEVAAGSRPADLVLTGGEVLDVHTGRLFGGGVAAVGPRIAAVGDVEYTIGADTVVLESRGLTILPGFVEPHLHVGGSQLSIERLAEVLVPRGTTTLATCFYEPAVVAGSAAVEELIDRASGSGLDVLLSPFHAAALGLGAFGDLGRFSAQDLELLLEHPACVELREWNYGVSRIPVPELQRAWMTAIRRRMAIGGHLEGLSGRELQASVALGARSDHETVGAAEAIEKAMLGVTVQIREGSGARDLDAVVKAITRDGLDASCFAFSTDEQELASITRDGHIDHKLRLAVGRGLAPAEAVRMATLSAAQSLGVADSYGAVVPGRVASLALVEDLATFRVARVISRGRHSAEQGEYLLPLRDCPYPDAWSDCVRVGQAFGEPDFLLGVPGGECALRVIGVTPGSLLTEELIETIHVDDGRVDTDGLAKIAVADRHEGGVRRAVGLVRGLAVAAGALAATVNPGLMNLMVLGISETDMALAANRVAELGGGIVVVRDGSIRAEVSLPLFGFLSHAPLQQTVASCAGVEQAIRTDLGCPVDGLLTSAGFTCLAVSIPRLKLCDRGLVRVFRDRQESVSLVVDTAGEVAAGTQLAASRKEG